MTGGGAPPGFPCTSPSARHWLPGCDRGVLLTEVTTDFSGPIIVGEDLMTIDPAARTVTHGGAVKVFGR